MTKLQLDWSNAEVSDGELTVAFSEKAPKKWRDAFQRTAALLSHGNWQIVKLSPAQVRVAPVEPGNEERVHHFLESTVLEANRTLVSEDELFEPDPAPEDEGEEGESREGSPDRELTARFREFAAGGPQSRS
ncbi:MAG TPA: hypothetical protein VME01_02415 [Solirubrobacteraceae bacterium]|nr:hypothetical protein [Solirubrobacteraceae bacterium]